jgi:hypothetical protein
VRWVKEQAATTKTNTCTYPHHDPAHHTRGKVKNWDWYPKTVATPHVDLEMVWQCMFFVPLRSARVPPALCRSCMQAPYLPYIEKSERSLGAMLFIAYALLHYYLVRPQYPSPLPLPSSVIASLQSFIIVIVGVVDSYHHRCHPCRLLKGVVRGRACGG